MEEFSDRSPENKLILSQIRKAKIFVLRNIMSNYFKSFIFLILFQIIAITQTQLTQMNFEW